MEKNNSEWEFESKRLEQTIALAQEQLLKAKQGNEENKSAIISAKQELHENTVHSISGLWGSEGFEALAELSQYVNPVINKIAEYEVTENRISQLENLIKVPYFARIDFKFDDEESNDDFSGESFEKIYIGRSSLMKENSYEMYVYDWRSPVASIFYRFVTGAAFYDSPSGKITGELGLKRQYEIKESVLEYFFDADVQIIDEFLRKMLSQNTSAKMKTIVETIQREQDLVIRDMENDLMMVQGVAGSGKTSIALHRAAYLMYQGLSARLSANNILIISPNSIFEQYISNVLPELGESNVESVVFEEILVKILKNKQIQSKNQFLERLIRKSKFWEIAKASIEFKTSEQFAEILNLYIYELPDRCIEFKDIYYKGKFIISKDELKSRILLGRKETPLGIKLKQLEEFIFEIIREQKKHIGKLEYLAIKNELLKFTTLDIKEIYTQLFSNREYFYNLSKDISLPSSIEDILTFTHENLSCYNLFYDDAIPLTYLHLKINGSTEYKNIKQVVIDEAQDYYPLQYAIFNLLFNNAKYTVLGDINQTLEKQEDLSLYKRIEKILNKKKASLVTMDKSFRCTNEILMYSLKFVEQTPEIKSFNREGDKPEAYVASNQSSFNDMITAEIETCLEKGFQSIGLICKTEKNAFHLFSNLKDRANVQLVKNESTSDLHGVFIIPVYLSKGLEFDAVLICDAQNYHSEDDKKLLYIGCTRALHRLNVFCKGNLSPLL